MSVASTRNISIAFTGDVVANLSYPAAVNDSSPGSVEVFTLSLGNNTITVPGGGTLPSGATIIPPALNTLAITLKGVNGDTGINLSKSSPTSISFDVSPPVSFVLEAEDEIVGLRIIWS